MSKKEAKKLQVLGKFGKGGVEIPGGAMPGQMIIVKAVDENGKPTEWEAVDRTHYETVTATPVSNDEITALVEEFDGSVTSENHIIEGLSFRVIVDGKVYDNVPIYNGCNVAGGTTWGIGDTYFRGGWKTTEYGFCVSLYGGVSNGDIFPDGIDSIEVQRVSEHVKQLDEKFIPDSVATVGFVSDAIEERAPKPVQPDLEQNDETAPDYVKGRTHWYEAGGEEVLPSTFISAENMEHYNSRCGKCALPGVTFPNPDVGEVYTVVFNGVAYTTKVVSTYGPPRAIGNESYFTGPTTNDTGEPFFIWFNTDGSIGELWFELPLDGVFADIIVAIYRGDKAPKYVPLDERFIPESIARKTDLSGNSGGGLACLTVELTNTGTAASPVYVANRTYDEIKAAYDEGALVFLSVDGKRVLIASCVSGMATFYDIGLGTIRQFAIWSNGTVSLRDAK